MKPLVYRLAVKLLKLLDDLGISERLYISDYCVCLRAAYVIVEGDRACSIGMAHVPRVELHEVGDVRPPSIEELPEMVVDLNPLNRVLGVATLNAISQYLLRREIDHAERVHDSPLLGIIEARGSPICVIGGMTPLVRVLKGRGFGVWFFEKDPLLRCSDCMSDAEELYLAPYCKTMIITGMALLNWSIDLLVSVNGPYKILIGPTAGVLPSLLKGEPIDAVASFHPTEIDKLRLHLRLGGYVTGANQSKFGIPYVYFVKPSKLVRDALP